MSYHLSPGRLTVREGEDKMALPPRATLQTGLERQRRTRGSPGAHAETSAGQTRACQPPSLTGLASRLPGAQPHRLPPCAEGLRLHHWEHPPRHGRIKSPGDIPRGISGSPLWPRAPLVWPAHSASSALSPRLLPCPPLCPLLESASHTPGSAGLRGDGGTPRLSPMGPASLTAHSHQHSPGPAGCTAPPFQGWDPQDRSLLHPA